MSAIMRANEKKARQRAATLPRSYLSLSTEEARTFLDWADSEEQFTRWMDWMDTLLRERLVRFINAHPDEET